MYGKLVHTNCLENISHMFKVSNSERYELISNIIIYLKNSWFLTVRENAPLENL